MTTTVSEVFFFVCTVHIRRQHASVHAFDEFQFPITYWNRVLWEPIADNLIRFPVFPWKTATAAFTHVG
jgi:hypothetical protein